MKPLVRLAVAAGVAASGCGGADSADDKLRPQAAPTGPGIEGRTIDAAVSVQKGAARVIYTIRGRHGSVGRFIGTCRLRRTPRTAYSPTRRAATAIAAVDGRGVSRAATVVYGDRLNGGTRPSGLEQWLIRMGRKSEDVTVEASLEIVRERGSPDCTFWLYGSITRRRR